MKVIQRFFVWLVTLHFIRAVIRFFLMTFVADCPVCHKQFFGFNNYSEQVKIKNIHYRIVCHRCVKAHIEHKN